MSAFRDLRPTRLRDLGSDELTLDELVEADAECWGSDEGKRSAAEAMWSGRVVSALTRRRGAVITGVVTSCNPTFFIVRRLRGGPVAIPHENLVLLLPA